MGQVVTVMVYRLDGFPATLHIFSSPSLLYNWYWQLKSIFFWDMTSCSVLSGTRRFGGTYRLHLQGRRIVQRFAELFYDPEGLPLACSLLCWTILLPWRWKRYVPPKRRVPLNTLHGVISQKKILFKTTAVKTSNPRYWELFPWE
jgi:hypothetical protein